MIGATGIIIDDRVLNIDAATSGVDRQMSQLVHTASLDGGLAVVEAWRERRVVIRATRAEVVKRFADTREIDASVMSVAAFPVGVRGRALDHFSGAVSVSFATERTFAAADQTMLQAAVEVFGSLVNAWPVTEQLSDTGADSVAGDLMTVGPLRIDRAGHQSWVEDRLIDLTKLEFEVLIELVRHRGQVLSKSQLLDLVWGYDADNPNVVEALVSSLRHKLESASTLIETVRGFGYVIRRPQTPAADTSNPDAPPGRP